MSTNTILQETYYNNNYPSTLKLFEMVKSKGVTMKETQKFLKDQLVYQLHFKPKPQPRRNQGSIVSGFENQMWMADLVDFQDVATRNKGYSYILTIVDVFSKKAQAIPLKNKGSDEMVAAFEKAFKERQPDVMKTDNGTEFINKDVDKVFDKYGITHILNQAGNHKEMGNIEKFNQTLLNMLFKGFTDNSNLKWIDTLTNVVNIYNNTFNGAIKSTPNDYDHQKLANQNAEKALDAPFPKLKKGDKVRMKIDKGAFGRGYTQNWSTDVFIVDSVTRGGLYTINGKKYHYDDLQKIDKVETNPFKTTKEPVISQPAIRSQLTTEKRLKQLDKEIGRDIVPNVRKVKRVVETGKKKQAIEQTKVIQQQRKEERVKKLVERTTGDATMKPRKIVSLSSFY